MQAFRRLTVAAVGVAALTAVVTPSARPAVAACKGSTTLVADGNLYVAVRSAQQRYLFGWSDQPVSSFPQAIRLLRKLGFTGNDAQLLRRLTGKEIPGSSFADAGSISNFTLMCAGTYTATALVRSDRGAITATRFWLQQGGLHVTRAFCMPEQWVPAGARVSVTFHVPLDRTSPTFAIDWNADGKIDSVGPFRPGGARFPSIDRC